MTGVVPGPGRITRGQYLPALDRASQRPTSSLTLAVGAFRKVVFYDSRGKKQPREFSLGESNVAFDTGAVGAVAWSKDGKVLASASENNGIRLWSMATGDSILIRGHKSPVISLSWSLDGRYLASSALDGMVQLWRSLWIEDLFKKELQQQPNTVLDKYQNVSRQPFNGLPW